MRRTHLVSLAALALLAAGTAPLRGQAPKKQYNVGAQAGVIRFRSAMALEDAPVAGIDGTYTLGWNPLSFLSKDADFGIGFNFNVARPLTRGDQFPIVAFDFGDTTQLLEVNQRITLMHYGVQAVLGMPIGRLRVYGNGGIGGYTIQLDSRQNLRNRAFTHQMFSVGGGIGYAVTNELGFRIEAKDLIFLGFERNKLDPTIRYVRDQRIRDAVAPPDPTWQRPQNLQLSIVFNYVPSRTTRTEGEQ
jgi:opacity protein-like surface antigen